jgi:cytochrome c2
MTHYGVYLLAAEAEMSVCKTSLPGDGNGLMARLGTWIDRLPGWLTAPAEPSPSGSLMGPREGLLMLIVFIAIAIWGFTGSWEYRTVETYAPVNWKFVSPIAEDMEPVATPVGSAVAGAELFELNGCSSCHSPEGQRKIGPSLRGIFGATVELNDGSSVLIDEAYLVESVLQPEAKRVAGYDDAAMPSYEGLVSTEDAAALVAYIKSLK